MMKNSKLSKLLVAGVSVAMLASALAPMAFADEASEVTGTASDAVFTLRVLAPKSAGSFVSEASETNLGGVAYTYVDTYINEDSLTSTVTLPTFEVNELNTFVSVYGEAGLSELTGTPSYGNVSDWPLGKVSTVSVADIVTKYSIVTDGTQNGENQIVNLVYTFETTPYVVVKCETGLDWSNSGAQDIGVSHFDATYSTWGDFKTKEGLGTPLKVLDNKIVELPDLIYGNNDGYVTVGYEIKVAKAKADGTADTAVATKYVGSKKGDKTYKDSTLNLSEFASYFKDDQTAGKAKGYVYLYPVVVKKHSVSIWCDVGTGAATHGNVIGVDRDENKKLQAMDAVGEAKAVVAGDTYELPVVKTDKAGMNFLYWTTTARKAGATSASVVNFVDGIFDPTVFEADTIKLTPVFTTAEVPEKVISYENVKTPNDVFGTGATDPHKLENGKIVTAVGTVGADMKFTKGLFYNQVDGTFAYYLPKNSAGRWELDTTVDGLKDGVFFADGKQDTEAYGLKKVSGAAEDDKFFYLVSDGLYVDDYTGIWVDEDGSIYNLINGCTSDVPFTGIVEKDGWATSVKDSMVDNKANGFILYGETQYWFINGTCNLNETEAVREHTDGNFYYTVGAKIDFTFNGECNGHTFVNGVASK